MKTIIIWTAALMTMAALAYAGAPKAINYQGYLRDSATGTPASGPKRMIFSLYSSNPARSNPVWRETQPAVAVNNGIYSTRLGSVNPITSPFDVPYYLGVKVGEDPEMTLQPLSSVPYALRATVADSVTGGSIGTAAIADSSVTSAKIANGAVSDLQISGPIPAAKLDLTGVQKKYGKVAVVAKSGGDYASPVAAMNDRAAWCGVPSSSNPCLLKIMPGVYDLAGEILTMQSYIDIEGSGERGTIITNAVGNPTLPPSGVVVGAGNAELRRMSIRNSGNFAYAAGIINIAAAPRISGVTVTVSGGTSSNYGVYNQLATSVVMDNMTINATGGTGSSYGIYNTMSSNASMKNIFITAGNAEVANYGVFNHNSVSPAMDNLTVRATGGINSYAVYNTTASPVMNNISATASATSASYAVYNSNASPIMQNVTATTEGGTSGYGIYNYGTSEPVMVNVDAAALYSTYNYGMYNSANFGAYNITIDRSSFTGAAYSIFNDSEFTLKIGGSRLSGPTNNLGSYTYLASYSDSAAIGAATAGTQTIQINADSSTGLVVKANSGNQSANLQEWQKSNGAVLAAVSAAGVFTGDASGLTNMKYGKTAVVAQSGGNYISPLTAMNALTNWCGTPSAANPCLLKLLPGVYDLGTAILSMQPFVDLEGSGENVTIITSAAAAGTYPPANGTLNGAVNAAIRNLGIRNTGGGGSYSAGLVNSAGAAPRMTHVTVTATGGTIGSYGIYNTASTPVMESVTANASGAPNNYGVYNNASSPAMNGVNAAASGGAHAYGVYNHASSVPAMNKVAATASGADSNHGIHNSSSSPVMNNSAATASGGSSSCGVYNLDSSPDMNGIIASATGSSSVSYGIYNQQSSLTMNNVSATASGPATTYGMYNIASSGSHSISIDRSSFSGTTNSIYNTSEYTLRIGASKLVGPANKLGTYIYLASYSDSSLLNSATTGTQTVQTGADASKGLIVKANSATQSANLQEWQDSSGVAVASISAAGVFSGVFTGDGSGLSGVVKRTGRTAVVATSGGDYTNPVTAMGNRAVWCDAPTAANPCLLKIMPGTYDLGDVSLVMQPYVDIEGSGEKTTIITSAVGSDELPPTATVTGSNDAEIRSLTIKNTGVFNHSAGMLINAASSRLKQVTVTATGYGVYISTSAASLNDVTVTAYGAGFFNTGIHVANSIPLMNNVTSSASGAGLSNNALVIISSAPVITNSTFTASGNSGATGIFIDSSTLAASNINVKATSGNGFLDSASGIYITAASGTRKVTIDRSSIEGSTNSVYRNNDESTYTVYIGGSKLTGAVYDGLFPSINENYYCVASYNQDYTALTEFCTP
ncbi:MAG: beta strand repeat-containing protein [Desulfuromonadaceae bacterium]